MEGQNVKKCQQKELDWNCSENKKLSYAFPRDKMTAPTECENELIVETKYIRIFILLLSTSKEKNNRK